MTDEQTKKVFDALASLYEIGEYTLTETERTEIMSKIDALRESLCVKYGIKKDF